MELGVEADAFMSVDKLKKTSTSAAAMYSLWN